MIGIRLNDRKMVCEPDLTSGAWRLTEPWKMLTLRPIGITKQVGLYDGETLVKNTVFEVIVEVNAATQRMTIIADPRGKDALGTLTRLTIIVGPLTFSIPDGTLDILWRDPETW